MVVLKSEVRLIGIDDAPFARGDETVPVVGVVMRGSSYVEAIMRTEVHVDGDDATDALAAMLGRSRHVGNAHAILTQNLMMGGFNVLDLESLHERLDRPLVAVARGVQDLAAQRRALLGGVPRGQEKWRLLQRVATRSRPWQGGRLTVTPVGLGDDAIRALLAVATVRGFMPEVLRLAHLIAAGWVLGESKGQ